jgi:hypothetical protein
MFAFYYKFTNLTFPEIKHIYNEVKSIYNRVFGIAVIYV